MNERNPIPLFVLTFLYTVRPESEFRVKKQAGHIFLDLSGTKKRPVLVLAHLRRGIVAGYGLG